MDQGVIRHLTSNYWKCMFIHILECLDENKVCSKNALNAIHFVDKAWRWVTEKTIQNTFWHADFASAKESETPQGEEENEEDLLLSKWNE